MKFLKLINKKYKNNSKVLNLNDLKKEKTIIFIVDMINGFCKKGNLSSSIIRKTIPTLSSFVNRAIDLKIDVWAFNDHHNEESIEFDFYPIHCVAGSEESQLVDELIFPEIKIFKKNSTNSIWSTNFVVDYQWKNIIVIGCCTDICILQFALSLKTQFNQENKKVNVIVPIDMVSTFDLKKTHPSKTMNNMALLLMEQSGIEVVKTIIS